MKTKFGILVVALVAGLVGFGVEKVLANLRRTQRYSLAAQTLQDFSRAVELEKEKTGEYPESVGALKVTASGGDFSQAVLQQIVYRKTTNGYVAFVGSPDFVYIEPGKSPQIVRGDR